MEIKEILHNSPSKRSFRQVATASWCQPEHWHHLPYL